ncbi:MAG: hypothetical protein WC683_10120 [bacterium]
MSTMIRPCTCQHYFQDARYGLHNRIHNQCKRKEGSSRTRWRCTVCGAVKEGLAGERQ